MKKVRTRLAALLLASLLLILTACGSSGSSASGGASSTGSAGTSPGGGPGKDVAIATGESLISLDPLNYKAGNTDQPLSLTVFESLVWPDRKGGYFPQLATEWTHNDAGDEWTFKLRDDVYFHNGDHFTAKDVVATYTRCLEQKKELSTAVENWADLKSVEAIDEYTVKITTDAPLASFLKSVAFTPIYGADAYAEYGQDLFTNGRMYGTGPWIFVEWIDGQHVKLQKNPDYWNKEYDSYYDTLTVRFIKEPSSAVSAHLSGTVQAYVTQGGFDSDLLPLYDKAQDRTQVLQQKDGTFAYFQFHMNQGSIFNDEKIREAFDLAIPRQTVIDQVMGGGYMVNSCFIDGCVGYDSSIPVYEYDPDKAKQLLAESSYQGEPITLLTSTGFAKFQDILLVASEELNAVGFNTKVETVEPATFSSRRSTGDYDIFLTLDMHTGGDPAKHINLKLLGDTQKHEYNSPEFYDLCRAINREMDSAKRLALISQLTQLMRREHAPTLTAFQYKSCQAIDYGIKGIEIYPDGTYMYKYIDYDPSLVPAK